MLSFEKTSFLHLPTPVEHLPNLSAQLGVELYAKRDDLTNLGAGGNKLRKLEYLLHDARAKGCTMLLTVGGAQTNHGRLTAAVAAKYNMKCAIVVLDDYPGEISANILLDRIMGAEVVLHKNDGTDLTEVAQQVRRRYEAQGEKVYFIPMGGSNEIGALGYYECAQEIRAQFPPSGSGRVVVAVGSMGTYMGLYCGLHGSGLALTGVLIGPFYENARKAAKKYFDQVREAWALDFDAEESDFNIYEEFLRGGYNNPVAEVRAAIYEMARREAILLDPCYTGKAYAAVKDLIARGDIRKGEQVLFLHTGGLPGLNTPHHRREMEKELLGGVTILP